MNKESYVLKIRLNLFLHVTALIHFKTLRLQTLFHVLIRISILGTSAKCLDLMEAKGLKPRETHKLDRLHTLLSTGSPLTPNQYDYVYKHIKSDVLLGSITGDELLK